ncbi:uncharacterized protein LOC112515196 isoform X2 [Cynara cardunculus var. scolymus]|uniref:AT hook, DNA-binding motif-containing protein n=1 Tax=Cynara cardunculus var. scolymus TaxID=59895 RepID=A0A103YF40_CYNCS|nr:uncharacterized protein LOC112515196 isoform X2 [Cynara cardunculus var. scolymus]KVI07947.1 AT hook, DNA-binding motif-containing protein [Cynara cardunculus var. scolymus]
MENKQSNMQIVLVDQDGDVNDDEGLPPGISVANFDYSVENHLKAMDKILEFSGESKFEYDQSEIQRMTSSVTFLSDHRSTTASYSGDPRSTKEGTHRVQEMRIDSKHNLIEWRHFCYQPQAIRFACQSEAPQRKDVTSRIINLTQFSSAAVPKDISGGDKISSHSSKDFVMYVGGLVWAMDWCPRVHERPDCDINLEFIAVAAHPPESSYHKIGAPLTGRGVIQIWGLLNRGLKDNDVIPHVKRKSKTNSSSNKATKPKSTQPTKPRGRPRKNPIDGSIKLYDNNQHLHAQAVQFPEDSTKLLLTDGRSHDILELVATGVTNAKPSAPKRPRGRPRKNQLKESKDNLDHSNKHLESLKWPEVASNLNNVYLETPENFSKGTCRDQNAPVGVSTEKQQDIRATETINFNVVKPMEGVRKKKTKVSADNLDSSNQSVKPLAVKFPEDNINVNNQYLKPLAITFHEDSSKLPEVDEISIETPEIVSKVDDGSKTHELVAKKDSGRKRKAHDEGHPEKSVLIASTSTLTKCKLRLKSVETATDLHLPSQKCGTSLLNADTSSGCGQDPMRSIEDKADPVLLETDMDSRCIPEDVALPRLVLCLAHNGKVAWDVKWRPSDTYFNSKHRMGYLAVLLGNGALEVWEVPAPHAVEVMFSACRKEGTDPRFIKLEPVFRCSMLKCGDRQSIPLTLEWSTSSPHDLILAGCHDGVVALWKFSADGPLKDTRPLLRFTADTVPIRALAWAPVPSDSESANIIVTAGHKGAKFWDLRDPFRPLWDVNPAQRIIYGLDWHPDPRCVVLSFDDGEIQIISLSKAACDVPVTGAPFVAAQRHASHSYHCSSSSIWSVQVSRLTGMVAYCCSDGKVVHFQLTMKAVEKDPSRNREPHYLCGAMSMEESGLTILSPLPDVPFLMKKSSKEWGDTPRTRRGYRSLSNQEKRAKEQMLKECQQPLAVCYDGNSDSETQQSSSSKKGKRDDEEEELPSKIVGKRDDEDEDEEEQELASKIVGRREDEEELPSKIVGKRDDEEELPSKIVGMYGVRWNTNKGSERWLCYGGAAGILRCQHIY